MEIITDAVEVETQGHSQIIDLTERLASCLARSGMVAGILTAFVPGSTAALTTIEFEPGLLLDIPSVFEKIAPSNFPYHHHETWQDDNGSAHIRAMMVGPSITVPFTRGHMTLGTWQQVVLMDFDTRPRRRRIVVQLMGTRDQ